MKNQKVYVLRNAKTRHTIESFLTLEEAEEELALYEEDDRRDGIYEEGFYEISEQEMDEDDAMYDRMCSSEYQEFLSNPLQHRYE